MDITYTSPIKFNFSPIPGHIVTFEFKLKGSKNRIKVNADINIFYKDPYIIGRVFLVNSGMQSVYTDKEDRMHTFKFKIPEYKILTQSYVYIWMEPAGDPYECIIIDNTRIVNIIPPSQIVIAQPHVTTAIPNIQPVIKAEKVQPIIQNKKLKTNGKLNIVCEGLMYGNSGFAKAMRNITYGLDKRCNIKTIVLDNSNTEAINTEEAKRARSLTSNNIDEPCFWITMTYPPAVNPHGDYYSIGYVMFETEDFPKNFSEHLNKQNEIWTPSTFCKNAMIKSGLNKVFVMPLGVDTDTFCPGKIDIPRVSTNWENLIGKFKFLAVTAYSERKGISVLVRAFAEEFKGQKDVVLYIKGAWYDLGRAQAEISDTIKDISDAPQIIIDFNIYSDDILATLYKACDCFVLPTKGEGYGLPIAEAMSTGMPTIVTKWGGHLEFVNEDNCYLIDIDGTRPEPRCDWITPEYVGRNFANPNKDHLKKLMRYVYNNIDTARQKGIIARDHMVKNYTWDKCCNRIYDRLNKITEEHK